MEHFEESKQDDEQLLMSYKLFSYVAFKYVAHHCQDFNCTLSVMRCLLGNDDSVNLRPSQIYYMELVNEIPYSDETMCIVTEDLLEKFNTKEQDGWVVLVGDGNTRCWITRCYQGHWQMKMGVHTNQIKATGQKSYTIITNQPSQVLLLVHCHGYLKQSSLMQCS